MTSVFVSTGAFSRDPDVTDPQHIVDFAKAITADGFELVFYPRWYDDAAQITDLFSRFEVNWHALHTEKSIGPLLGTGHRDDTCLALNRLRVNCQMADALGIRLLILHLWGLPDSDRNFESNLSAMDECIAVAKEFGLTLTIETIPCVSSTPLARVRSILARHPSTTITLDTEFLALHGELDESVTDSVISQAVKHVHVKDFDGSMVNPDGSRRYLHPGEGTLDLAGFLRRVASLPQRPSVCLESSSVRKDGSVDRQQLDTDLRFLSNALRTDDTSSSLPPDT